MDYLKLLNESYKAVCDWDYMSKYNYLSTHIFDFTTYDSEIDELFAKKAIEVCTAINDSKTFEYQEENYVWYLTMCNMPFFIDKLDWGTSIRGAWWADKIDLESCGIYQDGKQIITPLIFNKDEWISFIKAIGEFLNATH